MSGLYFDYIKDVLHAASQGKSGFSCKPPPCLDPQKTPGTSFIFIFHFEWTPEKLKLSSLLVGRYWFGFKDTGDRNKEHTMQVIKGKAAFKASFMPNKMHLTYQRGASDYFSDWSKLESLNIMTLSLNPTSIRSSLSINTHQENWLYPLSDFWGLTVISTISNNISVFQGVWRRVKGTAGQSGLPCFLLSSPSQLVLSSYCGW